MKNAGRGLEKIRRRYDYSLPTDRIANEPATPRDSAKLMILRRHTDRIAHGVFRDLADYLPNDSLLVFNRTKVVPARLALNKPTGGRVSVLLIDLKGKKLRSLVRGRIAPGTILRRGRQPAFKTVGRRDGLVILEPLFKRPLLDLLNRHGDAPLPPYIKNSRLGKTDRRARYQAIFAAIPGSIAAPTASLHFTKRLLSSLKRAGFDMAFVTLHVGLGTFAPLTDWQLRTGRLHEEQYQIYAAAARRINAAKRAGRPIIAVGTTALRAIESATRADGQVAAGRGATSLFIKEGYRFRSATGLITNFHVPKSSLLMLVSAFIGREKIKKAYLEAMARNYRFFSFGDAMLLLRAIRFSNKAGRPQKKILYRRQPRSIPVSS